MGHLRTNDRTIFSSPIIHSFFAAVMLLVSVAALGESTDQASKEPGSSLSRGHLFLEGGHLVDPQTGTVRRANLWIEDGLIAGTPEVLPKGFDGRVLDVTGQFVIPALRDMHVHSMVQGLPDGPPEMLGSDVTARRMAQVGVLAFLDLLHMEGYIFGLRDRQRQGLGHVEATVPGAEIFAAGAVLTAPGGHGTEYGLPARLVESPADSRRHVAELAELKADVVKLVYEHPASGAPSWRKTLPTMDRASLEAAVEAAQKHDLTTVVHIRSWRDVRGASEAGASAVTHLPPEPMPEGMAERLAKNGTAVIPTLAVGDLLFLEKGALDDPMLARVAAPAVIDRYRHFDRSRDWVAGMIGGMNAAQENRLEALGRLHRAGVTVVAGTDSGNSWAVHGYSLHRELELLVAAGFEPADALRAATSDAGRLVKRSWGLSRGSEGSVVVLGASPLEDIRATRQIKAVVHFGRVLEPEPGLVPARTMEEIQRAAAAGH